MDHYGQFEWDSAKQKQNLAKHGIDFETAIEAFKDPHKIIAVDGLHSVDEDRFFCIGKIWLGVLTVRFVYRRGKVRIIGAGVWRKGRKMYEKENK